MVAAVVIAVNIAHIVDPVAAAAPDRNALVVGDEAMTYGELAEATRAAAAALASRGVEAGARVPVAAECEPAVVAAVLGAMSLGASAAAMNPRLTPAELRALVAAAGCRAPGVAGRGYEAPLGAALDGAVVPAGDLLAGDRAVPTAVREEDEALVLFTSGTTGAPKPVPMTHGAIGRRLRTFALPFDATAPPQVAIMCLPFAHVGGLLGVLVNLAGGTTLVVQQRFDAGEWLRLVERHRVTRAMLVPTMLRRVLDHRDFGAADLSSLVSIAYGAAPAPPDLVARAVGALPHVAFVNIFGQTETLGAVTALGPDDHADLARRRGSVGRAMPGVDLRIVDPAGGSDVAPGDVGEIWVRAAFTGPDWVRTGDLGRLDEDGYLYPVGRVSERINRGGEKVVPSEVEAVLRRHPAVADAAVAGVPDEDLGERVAAVVVTRRVVGADELRAHCRRHLAGYKTPDRIVFVEEIPYNDVGKVPRAAVVALVTGMSPGR